MHSEERATETIQKGDKNKVCMVVVGLADEEFNYWDKHIHACSAPERCRIYISSVAGKSSDELFSSQQKQCW